MNNTDTHRLAKRFPSIALALLALLPVGALGSRFELWPYTVGLLLVAVSMSGSLLIQIVNAIWLMQKPAQGTRQALRRASLYALPPLAIVATVLRSATSGVALHDISTDTLNPPVFNTLLAVRGDSSNPLDYSPEKAQLQAKLYPELAAIENTLSASDNFQHALNAAEQQGWHIAASRQEACEIEAVATTFWFGFKDDISIRCDAGRVDIRSVSRVGRSDLGANASRIEKFQQRFIAASK